MNIDTLQMDLSKFSLIMGQIRPRSIVIVNPDLKIIRTLQNKIVFDVDDTDPPKGTSQGDGDDYLALLSKLFYSDNNTAGFSVLSKLSVISVKSTNVVIEDRLRLRSWQIPSVNLNLMRKRRNLLIEASLEMPGHKGMTKLASVGLFDPENEELAIDIFLSNADIPSLIRKFQPVPELQNQLLPVNGVVSFKLGTKSRLSSIAVDLNAAEGQIQVGNLYNNPFTLSDVQFKGNVDLANLTLQIDNASAVINDQPFQAKTRIQFIQNMLAGPVEVYFKTLDLSKLKTFWPDGVDDPSVEKWFKQKLPQGKISDFKLALDFSAHKKITITDDVANEHWDVDVDNINGEFDFDKTTIDYEQPLTPLTDAVGSASFYNNTLAVEVQNGNMGSINVKNGTIVVTNVIGDELGYANIAADMKGPLAGIFEYIQKDPINFENKKNIRVEDIKGTAKIHTKVAFPTYKDIPKDAVLFSVKGQAKDIILPKVLNDMALNGGPYDVAVNSESVRVSGTGTLDTTPVTIDYHEYFEEAAQKAPYDSRVTGNVLATLDFRQKLGIDISNYMSGDLPASVDVTNYQNGRTEAKVSFDIESILMFEENFDYVKPKGEAGSGRLTAVLKDDKLQDIKDFYINGQTVQIKNGLLKFTHANGEKSLSSATIEQVVMDKNSFAAELVSENDLLKIKLTGQQIDARPFLKRDDGDDEPYDGPAILMSGEFKHMIADPDHKVKDTKVYLHLDTAGKMRQLELDGTAGGKTVYLRYKPNEKGQNTLHIEADDAGATLQAFDLYDNVRGGKIIIYAEPVSDDIDGDLKGMATIQNFKTVKTPALARLFGALSLPGILQLLNSDGLSFSELNAKFDWLKTNDRDMYVFSEGRTTGNSLGLTFDGTLNRKTNVMDMRGTIVPASELNAIIGNIPLVGQLLVGEKGEGVFAATYSIKGEASNPKVSVNPLSVFTPGIFRKLFFEDKPSEDVPVQDRAAPDNNEAN